MLISDERPRHWLDYEHDPEDRFDEYDLYRAKRYAEDLEACLSDPLGGKTIPRLAAHQRAPGLTYEDYKEVEEWFDHWYWDIWIGADGDGEHGTELP